MCGGGGRGGNDHDIKSIRITCPSNLLSSMLINKTVTVYMSDSEELTN